MRLSVIGTSILLAMSGPVLLAQSKPDANHQKFDAKRCAPTVVSERTPSSRNVIHVRDGEKPTGFDPIIAFDILGSGRVIRARVKRSSGIAELDAHALNGIRSLNFNNRPGCEVLQSEASVTVDLR